MRVAQTEREQVVPGETSVTVLKCVSRQTGLLPAKLLRFTTHSYPVISFAPVHIADTVTLN